MREREKGRCRYLDLPISATFPCPDQSDQAIVPSRRAQDNLPPANPTPSQIYFPPSHTMLLFSFCNMSLPPISHLRVVSPLDASRRTRRKRFDKAPSKVPFGRSTDLPSQNLQQPVRRTGNEISLPRFTTKSRPLV